MRRVAVIDYGMGNLRSVSKALEAVGHDIDITVTADPSIIMDASHVVFPGVGAIEDCMSELKRLQLDCIINDAVSVGKPLLGICLGMQALLSHSEENGGVDCLNVIAGNVCKFNPDMTPHDKHLKVPHMGWNQVHQTIEHPLWHGINQDSRFYFVHSYFVVPTSATVTAATTNYPNAFTSAIYQDNVFAVQFHPEKSQHAGLKLLENFLAWNGQA